MKEKVYFKKGHDKRIRYGHLWVFSNELTEIPQIEPGSVVEVFDSNKISLGYGFFNPNSLIAVRLLKTFSNIDNDFFNSRFHESISYRIKYFPDDNMYRLVFGESDLLPGLIIDRFDDYLSLQYLSFGMEKNHELIVSSLLNLLPKTKGIILKNNSYHRINEGLEQYEKVIFGVIPEEIICFENNIKYSISLSESQKTGFYLDQKENRFFVRKIAKDKRVLDCYTNQGGFALNFAFGGAGHIAAVDVSNSALKKVEENSLNNSFTNILTVKADVADFLKQEIEQSNKYDVIVLDPPSFTKSKKNLNTAIAGNKKINKLALQLINKGGFLISSSCTHHLKEEVLEQLIINESSKQGRTIQLIYRGSQSADHPILAGMPETKYLKFFVFRVIK